MPGRQSRRSVLGTMAAVPLAGALSACSGGTSGSDSTSRTSTVSNKAGRNATHITFWSALRGSQEVVDAFNRTHDTIQVDFQQVPSGGQGGLPQRLPGARRLRVLQGRAVPRGHPQQPHAQP
ncbi:hypothetical protein ACFWNU_35815, partial [Streptomyces sp. NPDC058427]